MKVKICGVRAAADFGEIIRLAPNYLGVICSRKSVRYVSTESIKEFLVFKDRKTSVKVVGVFVDAVIDEIEGYMKVFTFDCIQLHGNEDNAYIKKIKEIFPKSEVWKAMRINEYSNTNFFDADKFVFDSHQGGSGETFDWELLKQYTGEKPFFLAGGLGNENIKQALALSNTFKNFYGIDASSKLEIEPGKKDLEKTKAFIKEVQQWDQ